MFSNLSLSSISFATETPSFVMVGSAVALLEHRVAALRAECRLHRIRKDVDALEQALARIVAKSYFFAAIVVSFGEFTSTR